MTNPEPTEGGLSRRSLLKRSAVAAGGLAVGASLTATPVAASDECPRTPGFWRTHPDAWPDEVKGADSLWLGGEQYSQLELLEILGTPARGRKWYILARQAIAAKLNYWTGGNLACEEVLAVMPICSGERLNCSANSPSTGCHSPVDCWLKNHDTDERSWGGAEPMKDTLDAYNNGNLCEAPCESTLGGPADPGGGNGN